MQDTPHIVLIGTGAVGSYYAGRLQQAGAQVSTVCRSDYEAVSSKGISVKSCEGDFHFSPEQVVRRISELNGEPDYIIVATKILPGIDVPSLIKDKVKKDTAIVLLQNGIDIEKPIQAAFPDNEIISGLAFICVSRPEYGLIDHQDYGRLIIGPYPSGKTEKATKLATLFSQAKVPCTLHEDIILARWIKLIWNAPFNPISVLAGGVNTRQMLNHAPTAALVKKVMQEVVSLAASSGHIIPEAIIQKNLDDTAVMTPYKTSMLLDYENGREMEVEAILGNAVRIASDKKVDIPHIESLYGLLSLLNKTHSPS